MTFNNMQTPKFLSIPLKALCHLAPPILFDLLPIPWSCPFITKTPILLVTRLPFSMPLFTVFPSPKIKSHFSISSYSSFKGYHFQILPPPQSIPISPKQ